MQWRAGEEENRREKQQDGAMAECGHGDGPPKY
jgi:hypothetical protein